MDFASVAKSIWGTLLNPEPNRLARAKHSSVLAEEMGPYISGRLNQRIEYTISEISIRTNSGSKNPD